MGGGRWDLIEGSGVFGTGFGDQGGGAGETEEAGAFFEDDGTVAEDLAFDLAVDVREFGVDGVEEFDADAALDAELTALHVANDSTGAADDQVTRAFDRGDEFAENEQVMALDEGPGKGTAFEDGDVAAGLDATVPGLLDLVVLHAEVAAAAGALAGLGLGEDLEDFTALETGNFDGRLAPHQPAEERILAGQFRLAEAEHRLWRRRRGEIWIAIAAGLGEAGDRAGAGHGATIVDLEAREAAAALRGDHECGFGLGVAAFRARQDDAMAFWLIDRSRCGGLVGRLQR